MIMRTHGIVVSTVFLMMTSAHPQYRDSAPGAAGGSSSGAFRSHCVTVGNIVGAHFDNNRLVLYASEPRDGNDAVVCADEVVELTQASILYGPHYGFSLDFERAGARKFEPYDVGDGTTLSHILQTSNDPIVPFIRERIVPILGQMKSGSRDAQTDLKLRKQLADILNAILVDDIAAMLPSAQLKPDVRDIFEKEGGSRRVRRLILEDLFEGGLVRDVTQSYVIRWKPDAGDEAFANKVLSKVFRGGRSESVALTADTLLKAFSTGDNLPPNVPPFGPSELSLCSMQFLDQTRRGVSFTGSEYVNFFDFDIDYDSRNVGLPGRTVWFIHPRLFVTAKGATGGAPPACAERFASTLTNNIPRLLTDRGVVGQRLRNLEALLTLNRAVGWLIGITNVDLSFLRSVSTKKDMVNVPPKVVDMPIVFAPGNKPVGIRVSGGIRLNSGAPVPRKSVADDESPHTTVYESVFEVSSVMIDDKKFLRIDVSSVVLNTK